MSLKYHLRQLSLTRPWSPDRSELPQQVSRCGEGELLRSVTSNAGHLLPTPIPTPGQAQRVAERLMAPDMFSGCGVRTLSTTHRSYHPCSYHLGSVWPVEQATIAAGFGRYGEVDELHRTARASFDLAGLFEDNRIPERVGGIVRDPAHPHPGI